MNDLIIMDYATCTVHKYRVPNNVTVNDSYLRKLGYRECDCYYMIAENIKYIEHENIEIL
jgi:hypothetical protein